MRLTAARPLAHLALCLALACGAAPFAAGGAQASHCPALSDGFARIKKMGKAVAAAEARDDMEGACRLQKELVAYEKNLLESTKTACFHGGRPAFEMAVKASEAMVELYCDWDDEDEDF